MQGSRFRVLQKTSVKSGGRDGPPATFAGGLSTVLEGLWSAENHTFCRFAALERSVHLLNFQIPVP